MGTRIKLPSTIISRTRAEELLGEIASLKVDDRTLKTQMDRELTEVRDRYTGSIVTLEKQIEEKTVLLESWAAANPAEFPKGRKSLELLHGVLGYRTGTPKLKLLGRRTWELVLEAMRGTPLRGLIRTKEEVNKEGILAGYAQNTIRDADLAEIGVKVVQDETFFVEVRLEELATRQTQQAIAA
jgi:phage host-nuclease inhibitor protein Gam